MYSERTLTVFQSKLNRVSHLAVLKFTLFIQLVAQKKLEDEQETWTEIYLEGVARVAEADPAPTNDEEAPERPEEGVAELSVEVLADEDDDAEVGVEAVADEEGREDEEPGSLAGQKLLLDLGEE